MKEKRFSGDDMELAILDMLKSQQESIQRSEQNDESFFEALLKSRAEAQRLHQDFFVSVLGKLLSASKKSVSTQRCYSKEKKGNSLRFQKESLNDLVYHFGH